MTFKYFIAMLLFSNLLNAASIQKLENLKQDGALSAQTKQPIFLYVAAIGCPYCKRLEKDIIKPMFKSGEYEKRLLMRKIIWEDSAMIYDFNGEQVLPVDFLLKYNIMATPTILFLDKNGHEIAKRLNGYLSPDLYWFYLDRSVDNAVKVLASKH